VLTALPVEWGRSQLRIPPEGTGMCRNLSFKQRLAKWMRYSGGDPGSSKSRTLDSGVSQQRSKMNTGSTQERSPERRQRH
jgi:hypothetical protein